MLTALAIISLLSLLVATEAEPAGSRVDVASGEPLRPKAKACCAKGDDADRLAA